MQPSSQALQPASVRLAGAQPESDRRRSATRPRICRWRCSAPVGVRSREHRNRTIGLGYEELPGSGRSHDRDGEGKLLRRRALKAARAK
jgi:hypothetical protein